MASDSWIGKPTTARVAGDAFYYVESPADPAVARMEETAKFRDKVMLAWAALIADPGCIEAHVFAGRHARDPELRMLHLKRAVETGEELWEPVAEEEGDDMTWWGFAATRPYMRAIQALGMEHAENGDDVAARICFERLLDMNPNDNQGIRHTMANLEPTAAPKI